MNSPGETPAPDVDQQAAAWLARMDRGFSAAEQDAFFQWLAAAPRHGEVFSEHRATVQRLRQLAQWRPEHGAQPNPDLLAPSKRAGARTSFNSRMLWSAAAMVTAAAAIAVVFMRVDSPSAEPGRAPVGGVAASLDVAPARVEGVRRLLDDGSTVDLRAGSRIEVQFTVSERRVRLTQGAAHFTVAKNAARPFVVETEHGEIRALGTAFDVQLAADEVEVLVTEGKVAVSAVSAERVAADEDVTAIVAAGQRTLLAPRGPDEIAARPAVLALTTSDRARMVVAAGVAPRQLEFSAAPLAWVVAEFNRDNPTKLVVADPTLAAMPIGASLRSDNVEGFVRLLEHSFAVAVERPDVATIVLRRRAPAAVR